MAEIYTIEGTITSVEEKLNSRGNKYYKFKLQYGDRELVFNDNNCPGDVGSKKNFAYEEKTFPGKNGETITMKWVVPVNVDQAHTVQDTPSPSEAPKPFATDKLILDRVKALEDRVAALEGQIAFNDGPPMPAHEPEIGDPDYVLTGEPPF